jgi:hypothetical protein
LFYRFRKAALCHPGFFIKIPEHVGQGLGAAAQNAELKNEALRRAR